MNDHETFQLLAAREVHEPLSVAESAALHPHLAGCPDCRALAAGMRRDEMDLRAVLAGAPVADRVRRRVMDEASGRRHLEPRLVLALAAVLVLAFVAIPVFLGGSPGPTRPPSAAPDASPASPPSSSPDSSASPTGNASPSTSPTLLPSVTATLSGVYTYVVFGGPGRGVSIQAQVRGGVVNGAWSLWSVDGSGQASDATSGRVTCLVVSDRDAFAFGPADDGGPSVFFWVHDGADTATDRAMTWIQDPGEPESDLEGWCRNAGAGYAQRQPVPLTSGSLIVEPDPSPSSPAAGASVNGAYAYTVGAGAIRRGSVTAHFDDGPVGEWSQTAPATGGDASFGGPVTCLEVDGPDAWLAGPATRASDGATDRAALLYVHDGGPDGRDDAAMLWMNDPGQTLQTMEGWCRSRFVPGELYPLDEGDVAVDPGG